MYSLTPDLAWMLIAASGLVAASLGAIVALLGYRTARKRVQQAVQLSATRDYYENEIRDLVEKLTASKSRWEEVNHLVLSAQRSQPDQIQAFDPNQIPLLEDMGLLSEDLSIIPDLAFVLAPVLKEEEATFRAIADACSNNDLVAIRADLLVETGDILRQVVRNIARARVVIANVGTRNPNVFYELGIAHALGKITILVSKTSGELSFNIAQNRVVMFSDPEDLMPKLSRAIRAAKSGEKYFVSD